MKRLATILLTLAALAGAPAFAGSGIQFSPDAGTAGNWSYDGAGTLSFNQYVAVDAAMGSNADALVGSLVFVPTLSVNASGGGSYSLKPLGSSILTVRSADDSTIYI
ncbi:MAG: hypothetical protein ABIF19_19730 [Planctomycetota bacterium]